MTQSIDEILDDLRSFVGGKGREDNFCYSKVYSSSSYIRCVDFSQWIGMRLEKNDIFALAVLEAQLSDEGSLKREVNRHRQKINHILQFPFEKYFETDIHLARFDLVIAWLLGYSGEQFAKTMMPYHLKLKDAKAYLDEHNRRRKKQYQLPDDLPQDTIFEDFQHELRKLALASRLHLFDVFEYSRFGKIPSKKPLSYMTLYLTRAVGIDETQSAKTLQQSKLITSFPDGTGFIPPEYVSSVSIALDYAKKIAPVYYEWRNEAASHISKKLGVYYYDYKNPNEDGYLGSEDVEE